MGTHGVDVSGVIHDRVAHAVQEVSDHVAFAFYVDGVATAKPVAARAKDVVYLLRHLRHTQPTTLHRLCSTSASTWMIPFFFLYQPSEVSVSTSGTR